MGQTEQLTCPVYNFFINSHVQDRDRLENGTNVCVLLLHVLFLHWFLFDFTLIFILSILCILYILMLWDSFHTDA